jgi:hypothetical protein
MSGEAHPKELDEIWDSQIFRYSKMFPLKTKFFCYQALLFTHPCVPAPWFVASSRVYTFLVCTFLQMYPDVPRVDRAFLILTFLGSLPNQDALSFRYGAFLFACLSFPISIPIRLFELSYFNCFTRPQPSTFARRFPISYSWSKR